MQILTAPQVEYCHLIVNKLAESLYAPGLSFQNKLFVRDQIFTYSDKQKAIYYCEKMYLANKGSKFCLLLEETAGFTVWIEDKSARVIGSKSPEDVITELKSDNLIVRLQNIEIDISDLKIAIDSEAGQKQLENLETSLHKAIGFSRKLMN